MKLTREKQELVIRSKRSFSTFVDDGWVVEYEISSLLYTNILYINYYTIAFCFFSLGKGEIYSLFLSSKGKCNPSCRITLIFVSLAQVTWIDEELPMLLLVKKRIRKY